jgi:hypothetical protein
MAESTNQRIEPGMKVNVLAATKEVVKTPNDGPVAPVADSFSHRGAPKGEGV